MTPSQSTAHAPPTPLNRTPPGQRVRISRFECAGHELRCRLCALGLVPGMTVVVVTTGGGPVILDAMGSRLVLGHGVASRILVNPA